MVIALHVLLLGVIVALDRIRLGQLVGSVPEGIRGVLDVLDLRYSSIQLFL